MEDAAQRFDAFVRSDGARLRRALVAAYGPVEGNDAVQAALSYGWEHWARVGAMSNPAGYLYRVGQTSASRTQRHDVALLPEATVDNSARMPELEPGLAESLAGLTESQRIAVVLVHGHGHRLAEVAELLDVSVSTLRNHLRRGLTKLRTDLGVDHASV